MSDSVKGSLYSSVRFLTISLVSVVEWAIQELPHCIMKTIKFLRHLCAQDNNKMLNGRVLDCYAIHQ